MRVIITIFGNRPILLFLWQLVRPLPRAYLLLIFGEIALFTEPLRVQGLVSVSTNCRLLLPAVVVVSLLTHPLRIIFGRGMATFGDNPLIFRNSFLLLPGHSVYSNNFKDQLALILEKLRLRLGRTRGRFFPFLQNWNLKFEIMASPPTSFIGKFY